MSLKIKFSIITGAVVFIVGIALSLFYLHQATDLVYKELKEKGIILATHLAKNSREGVATNNIFKTLNPLVETLKYESDVKYILIFNTDGRILSHSDLTKIGRISKDEFTKLSLEAKKPIITDHGNPEKYTCRECHNEIKEDIIEIGMNITVPEKEIYKQIEKIEEKKLKDENIIGGLRIGISQKVIKDKIKNILFVGFIITFGLVCLGVFLVFIFASKITKPIRELVYITKEISNGDLSYYAKIRTKDEIGDLTISFNKMTDQLKTSKQKIEEYTKTLEQKVEERTKELKESNEKLIQTSKLAAVGQLAGGVAHEINNPLGVILGFSQSITKRIKEDDQLYMPLKSIEREAVRCKKLVSDLLTFSRVSRIQAENININTTIDETLSLVEVQTKIKNIEIIREFGDGLPQITANKNQIQQVVMNLCNNAIDAMSKGGSIKIATSQQVGSRNDSSEKGFIEISVIDTGEGMTNEVKQHIFEPFFTTKEVGKGTGLGLSLCYEIVQKHKGSIEVESGVGKGTKFIIKLPVK